jgi:uncharacterized membrane protein
MMPTMLASMRKSVREICEIEEETLRARTPGERLSDVIVNQSGRFWFIVFHGMWFAAWILLNAKSGSKTRAFDPFPYPLLTLVVSLESIFLSLFILMGQNRSSRTADERAHLDLQINLLAERESTKALELLQALCKHHGLHCGNDAELQQLVSTTRPAEIIQELKEALPTTPTERRSDTN